MSKAFKVYFGTDETGISAGDLSGTLTSSWLDVEDLRSLTLNYAYTYAAATELQFKFYTRDPNGSVSFQLPTVKTVSSSDVVVKYGAYDVAVTESVNQSIDSLDVEGLSEIQVVVTSTAGPSSLRAAIPAFSPRARMTRGSEVVLRRQARALNTSSGKRRLSRSTMATWVG